LWRADLIAAIKFFVSGSQDFEAAAFLLATTAAQRKFPANTELEITISHSMFLTRRFFVVFMLSFLRTQAVQCRDFVKERKIHAVTDR
jgi:hypothetical protein